MIEDHPLTGKKRHLTLFCVLLFLFTWFLYTQKNQFPFFYHPDEAGKAEQVLTGKWNYHHPMMLLTTASAAVKIFGGEKQPQSVIITGRQISALFATLAVIAFTLLAFHFYGMAGAIPVGLALALHHQIFELAHYMKEDTALLCGMALTLLGVAWYWSRPTLVHSALLGFASAVAVAGKYLGVIFAITALGVLLAKRRNASPRLASRILVFFAALVVTFVICNLPLVLDFQGFKSGLDREMETVVEGQGGVTRSVPHSQYWSAFLDNNTPLLLLGLILYAAIFFRTSKTRTTPEWILILLPLAYALLLSFSPKSNDRYFLPAAVLFTFLGVIGLLEGIRRFDPNKSKPWLWPCVILLIVASQVFTIDRFRGVLTYYQAFSRDDVQDHIDYIRANLPSNAVIAQDSRVGLPLKKNKERLTIQPLLDQKVISKKYVSDLGTLEELQQQGVTHLAVSESAYGRFFLKSLTPQKGGEVEYARDKKFYADLFANYKPIWERERGTVIYLHPGIQLYELKKGPADLAEPQ